MTSVVCPGTFDPITLGHLDVIQRAADRFEHVVVACGINVAKAPMFTVDDRLGMLRTATGELGNVDVEPFDGLLVDLCRRLGVRIIVKGLRAVSDFEYELQMAQMNAHIGDVETLFIPASPIYSYLSSSLVKEVARLGGDISGLVPEMVARAMRDRVAGTQAEAGSQ